MASNPETAAPKLRWLRALVAAFAAEVVLICIAIPIYATTAAPTPILNMVIPPTSGLVFLFAGYWAALPIASRGTLQGALTGAWAVALYLGLGLIASLFVKGTSVTDGFTAAYLAAHALKIIGGAIGGWLVSRKDSSA
jgi:putative membrane protein (TIGR04086 family)